MLQTYCCGYRLIAGVRVERELRSQEPGVRSQENSGFSWAAEYSWHFEAGIVAKASVDVKQESEWEKPSGIRSKQSTEYWLLAPGS